MVLVPLPAPPLSRAPHQSWGAQQEHAWGEDRSVTPFCLLIGAFPSLCRRSLWTVIFSSRYFPQANFSVTFHPFLSVSGCCFLPSRCLLFQLFSPSAFPHARSLSGMEGRELGAGLETASRQRLAEPGWQRARAPRAGFGKLSQHPRGAPRWRQAGGAGKPLAAPQRAGLLWQLCGSGPGGSQEERGRLKAP